MTEREDGPVRGVALERHSGMAFPAEWTPEGRFVRFNRLAIHPGTNDERVLLKRLEDDPDAAEEARKTNLERELGALYYRLRPSGAGE